MIACFALGIILASAITLSEYTEIRHNPYIADIQHMVGTNQYTFDMYVDNTTTPSVEPWPKSPRIYTATLNLEQLDTTLFHFTITDPAHQRWKVPEFYQYSYKPIEIMDNMISFQKFPFSILFKNPITSETILSFGGRSLKYFDKYLEIEVELPTHRIFGLGEQIAPFELPTGRYSLFDKDQPSPISDGLGGKGMYSTHPVYVNQIGTKFNLIYFKNSNAQDYFVNHYGSKAVVTHKSVGGIFEFYIVLLGSMDEVVQKYHSIIGLPYLPPFWSLGMHQCKWGYRSIWDLKRLVRKFDQSGVPLDVILPDIDYMHEYEDFSIDQDRFPNFIGFSAQLRSEGVHIMPNHDIGLSKTSTYKFYQQGKSRDNSFIMSGRTNQPVVASVWPGKAVFPDFFSANGSLLWWEGLEYFHNISGYDALMLDMEDISAFCDGECPNDPDNTLADKFLRYFFGRGFQKDDAKLINNYTLEYDNLPYHVGLYELDSRTVSMESYHYSTDEYGKEHYKQYNLHNIYNYYENKMTHDFIEQKLNRRPYVVSRSTSPGCGRHVSKWLGDNFASWTHMRMSIVGMLNFQIFGVPHVGADICGFVGNPDAELCARWYQLGAFSPFTRNQNFVTMIPQEPYEFGGIVVEAARNSILQKYSIARYYYNNMFDIAMNGGMLVRALFYDYPSDAEAYATKELTFLIGKGILVVPILFPGAKNVSVYLPPSIWYDLRNYSQVSDITKPHNISFEASYSSTIVLIKGGEIIPFQDALRYNTKRIRDLDSLPTVLLVALDENETARGKLIVDNTDEPYTIRDLAYRQYSFSFDNRALKFSKIADNIEQRYGYEILEAIVIMGAIQFNQSTEAFVEYNNGDSATCQCKFFTGNNTLQIQLKADIRTIKEISIR